MYIEWTCWREFQSDGQWRGVYQHVKVSILPLLCDESQRQLCFCVCDYFLLCSVVMLPVFIYAACKRFQLCWYRETCLRQPPLGKSVQLVFTQRGGCITEIDCNGLYIITYSAMLLGSWEAGCFREVASLLQ